MIKYVEPNPYYVVDMHSDFLKEYSEEIYDWAMEQDAWLPDGDGNVKISLKQINSGIYWITILWHNLNPSQQLNILHERADLYIGVSQ